MRFDETALSDEVLDALEAMHFQECTPVQEMAIPTILRGRDLLAVAQTGTGKTAAYLLPIIDQLLWEGAPQDAINCVVMVPTRELAIQISQQLDGFAYFVPITSIAVYGGTDGKVFAQQQKALKEGVDIVIATPGRLLAHMQMGTVDLQKVRFLVLDEADRMLDMGFYDDIMHIVNRTDASRRQTLLLSATMPPAIEKLARSVLRDPEKIELSMSKPAEKIRQTACLCDEGAKEAVLLETLRSGLYPKVIVFAASKLKVKDMSRSLRRAGVKVSEMHSDLDQEARSRAMHAFNTGELPVLVATDIVARGIDIDNVALVVNFDVPHDVEDYVHRVGRTARADHDGTSLTLVSPRDRQYFRRIEDFLGKKVERIVSDKAQAPAGAGRPEGGRPRGEGRPRGDRPRRQGPRGPRKEGNSNPTQE